MILGDVAIGAGLLRNREDKKPLEFVEFVNEVDDEYDGRGDERF
jgi:hypothetical protein